MSALVPAIPRHARHGNAGGEPYYLSPELQAPNEPSLREPHHSDGAGQEPGVGFPDKTYDPDPNGAFDRLLAPDPVLSETLGERSPRTAQAAHFLKAMGVATIGVADLALSDFGLIAVFNGVQDKVGLELGNGRLESLASLAAANLAVGGLAYVMSLYPGMWVTRSEYFRKGLREYEGFLDQTSGQRRNLVPGLNELTARHLESRRALLGDRASSSSAPEPVGERGYESTAAQSSHTEQDQDPTKDGWGLQAHRQGKLHRAMSAIHSSAGTIATGFRLRVADFSYAVKSGYMMARSKHGYALALSNLVNLPSMALGILGKAGDAVQRFGGRLEDFSEKHGPAWRWLAPTGRAIGDLGMVNSMGSTIALQGEATEHASQRAELLAAEPTPEVDARLAELGEHVSEHRVRRLARMIAVSIPTTYTLVQLAYQGAGALSEAGKVLLWPMDRVKEVVGFLAGVNYDAEHLTSTPANVIVPVFLGSLAYSAFAATRHSMRLEMQSLSARPWDEDTGQPQVSTTLGGLA